MSDEELTRLDATGQAELVRSGRASPAELVEAAITRIEKLNPELGAVVTPLFDKARAQARAPDLPEGPFRGVPFLLKDLICASAGDPPCFLWCLPFLLRSRSRGLRFDQSHF